MAAKTERKIKIVADNRKARFNYEIGEVFEWSDVMAGAGARVSGGSGVGTG